MGTWPASIATRSFLELARTEHGAVPNLRFERGDVTGLRFRAQFDIATAARTLQWIADPALAISQMKLAAKTGGMLVVLDYNHASNTWDPEPPSEFKRFYSAFLAWRDANGWDNGMADHLPELFRAAGLADVTSRAQDEVALRGGEEFAERTALWSEVIENVGEQLAGAGFCTELELKEARECYRLWVKTELLQQTLALRAVAGTVP